MSQRRLTIGKPTTCEKCGSKKMYRTEWPFTLGRAIGRVWFLGMPVLLTALGLSFIMGNTEKFMPYFIALGGIPLLLSKLFIGIGEILPQQEHRTCQKCGATTIQPAKKISGAMMIMGMSVSLFLILLGVGTLLIFLESKGL